MKSTVVIFAFVLVACFCLETSNAEPACKPNSVRTEDCVQYTCNSKGDGMTAITCALYQCQPGKQIGEKPNDNSKPYPQCCGGPICKD